MSTRHRSRGSRRWATLDRGQRRVLWLMGAVVLALHLLGFLTLVALVAPRHYHLGKTGAFTIGIGLTAYTLGMRHAFDADHISAIDNTTRKLMADGGRPLSVGFWFSLGHSTVVFALSLLVSVGIKSVNGSVSNGNSSVHQVTTWAGTLISGCFLYVIAAINAIVLLRIIKLFREMKSGGYDEQQLQDHLSKRGLINRVLGKLTNTVTKSRHMYPIGLLFGLGFDTASEVSLLVLAGGAAGAGLPWYAILCLPILFAAGMSLLDTLDGSFMNFAYGWALDAPVRRVFYNITITGLSVAVALIIGTVELGGLAASQLNLSGAFWTWFENINLNLLGFVIVGTLAVTWAAAFGIWRVGKFEQRWGGRIGALAEPVRAPCDIEMKV